MSEEALETGHEPTTPAGDTLLRGAVLAMTGLHTHLAETLGGRVARWDDVVAVDRGLASPMVNVAVLQRPLTGAEAGAEDVAVRLAAFYGSPGPGPGHGLVSPWPTPDLRPYGYSLMGHPPFMVRPAGGAAPPWPPGLEVVEATDAATLAAVEQVAIEGFPMADLQPVVRGTLLDERALGGPVRFWLGRADGRPAAVAAAHAAGGVVDVEMVATMPAARRRGYGAAVTWAATLADPTRPAVLIASDPGRPVYESMGYLPVTRFTFWFRP